jgi:glycosyltransferase involved in cell wall biosynthesis
MKPYNDATLSVVTPVYRNEQTLEELARQVFAAAAPIFGRVEYIFVNDCSPDGSRQVLKSLADGNPSIKVINLARNFGQHVALMIGMRAAMGDYVFLIDGDLEESPAELAKFAAKMSEGHEIVVGQRANRRASLPRALASKLYFTLFNALSDRSIIVNGSTMRLMTARYVSYLTTFSEHPFIAGITSWIGIPVALVPVQLHERAASGYSLRSLLRHARAGILGFSTKPIRLATYAGMAICSGSLLYLVWVLARYSLGGVAPGFTSLVTLFALFMGIQFLFIGLLGEYVAEIFIQTKNRPGSLIYDRFGFGD